MADALTLYSVLSTISSEGDLISSDPALSLGRSVIVISVSSDSETSVSLTGGGETSVLSMLVLGRGNPVDLSISGNGLVVGVNKDDFVEFVGSVLTNPVRVEDSEVFASPANSLFSDGSVGSARLEGVNTLVDGLSVHNTLADGLLSATSSNSDSVDDIALLSLVTELPGLVRSG